MAATLCPFGDGALHERLHVGETVGGLRVVAADHAWRVVQDHDAVELHVGKGLHDLFALLALLLGALFSTLTGEIYKLYEGRTGWSPPLLRWSTARQQARLGRLRQASDRARAKGDMNAYNEAWYLLRLYPLDDSSRPEVQRPTLLGNILAGYEQYSDLRYGMDSVFYWPRIWLEVEKEKKDEIDSQWSVADGFLLLSAVCLGGGLLWILGSAAGAAGWLGGMPLPLPSFGWIALAALGWWLLGYGFYRLSLPFHRENGELFKAIFDLYRGKIWNITHLRPQEKQIWDATWSYLQYFRVVCPNCGNMAPVANENCPTCGFDIRPALQDLQASGKFPLRP